MEVLAVKANGPHEDVGRLKEVGIFRVEWLYPRYDVIGGAVVSSYGAVQDDSEGRIRVALNRTLIDDHS